MTDSYVITGDPTGERVLTLRGDLNNRDRRRIAKTKCAFVFVRSGDHRNIDYLCSSFDSIRSLDIGTEHFDWSVISQMNSLEKLSIGYHWNIPWHSFQNKNVESLSFAWNRAYSLDDLPFSSLRKLKIIGWAEDNPAPNAAFENLTYLDLVDSRRLEKLEFLRTMQSLTTLRLRGAPKLQSLEGVQALGQLVVLHLERLKKLEGYDELRKQESLRGLIMRDCSPLDSLATLSRMRNLELLTLGSTEVADGDMAKLRDLPALRQVMYKNRRKYNWNSKDAKEHFQNQYSKSPELSEELQIAIKMYL